MRSRGRLKASRDLCDAAGTPPRLGAELRRERFSQRENRDDQGQATKTGGHEGWQRYLDMGRIAARQHAAECRPEHEAKPECRTQHAHALGPVLRRGDIGDIGLGDRDVAGRDALQRPRREQHPQRIGRAQPQIGQRRGRHADQHDRPPSNSIAEAAPERRRQQLQARIGRHQRGDCRWRSMEMLAVEGQQRNDDAESQEVDEYDQEHHDHSGDLDSEDRPRNPAEV